MKFRVLHQIFCVIFYFQLVKCEFQGHSNGTIYIKHGNGTGTQEQPKLSHYGEHSHHSEHIKHKEGELKQIDDIEHEDHYTFLALIEIMFNDGSRKNCTGAIIHDNVVITAAHCFEKEQFDSLKPELTGSFVIIGSKKMFETGYEQYLPIERVVIHPDYKGWKADLALVYTFAGMMSDKPGNIIPLAEGNSFSSLHAFVTVLNWDQIKRKGNSKAISKKYSDSSCSQSSEEKETYFHRDVTRPIYSNIYEWSREKSKPSRTKKTTYDSKLFLEDYTIFEIESCKKLVQKIKPATYQIENGNKTLCYFTKDTNKVQANSGAPAVHLNHLVAIAAGDFANQGEHIIVGTKLSCYCQWISENLPGGGNPSSPHCCETCCNEMYFKSNQDIYY